jgi:ferredoxin
VAEEAWIIVADLGRCEGHGLCVEQAPGHFQLESDELVLTGDRVADADLPAVRSAVRVCPVAALRVERQP